MYYQHLTWFALSDFGTGGEACSLCSEFLRAHSWVSKDLGCIAPAEMLRFPAEISVAIGDASTWMTYQERTPAIAKRHSAKRSRVGCECLVARGSQP